jgi:DNA segregation ATPase FtsK/SpoIIIE-like protein
MVDHDLEAPTDVDEQTWMQLLDETDMEESDEDEGDGGEGGAREGEEEESENELNEEETFARHEDDWEECGSELDFPKDNHVSELRELEASEELHAAAQLAAVTRPEKNVRQEKHLLFSETFFFLSL